MSTMSTIEDAATPLDLSSIPYLELYYSIPMRLVASLICAINLGVGFIGNLLVILVVLTAKARMLTPTNCYLVSLSAADLIVLVVDRRQHQRLLHHGFLSRAGTSPSVIQSAPRPLAPVKRAKRIIFGVWLFGLVYNSPWIYLAMIKQKSMFKWQPSATCLYNRSNGAYMSLYLGDLVLFYLIPLGTTDHHVLVNSSDSVWHGVRQPISEAKADQTVVKMLLVVVVLFALLWLPYRFLVAYNSIAPAGYRISSEWYVIISRLLVYSNSAVNPVIYNAMSVKFRREFRRLLIPL
uniref:Thyrotropin-releasing hormone receptor n=1 Tax=Macrostomum lignano TaxID=282301 RepID=A0A1I8I153_9PLAT